MTGGRCTWPLTKTAPASVEPYPSVKWHVEQGFDECLHLRGDGRRARHRREQTDRRGGSCACRPARRPRRSVGRRHRRTGGRPRSGTRWNSMSQIRGTKLNLVGRTNARSSKNVERSLLATKYAVPPAPSVEYRTPRPMMWLIGMIVQRDRGERASTAHHRHVGAPPEVGDPLPRCTWRLSGCRCCPRYRSVGPVRRRRGRRRGDRQRVTAGEHVGQSLDDDRGFGESRGGGGHGVAVVVHLAVVVEHHQPLRGDGR